MEVMEVMNHYWRLFIMFKIKSLTVLAIVALLVPQTFLGMNEKEQEQKLKKNIRKYEKNIKNQKRDLEKNREELDKLVNKNPDKYVQEYVNALRKAHKNISTHIQELKKPKKMNHTSLENLEIENLEKKIVHCQNLKDNLVNGWTKFAQINPGDLNLYPAETRPSRLNWKRLFGAAVLGLGSYGLHYLTEKNNDPSSKKFKYFIGGGFALSGWSALKTVGGFFGDIYNRWTQRIEFKNKMEGFHKEDCNNSQKISIDSAFRVAKLSETLEQIRKLCNPKGTYNYPKKEDLQKNVATQISYTQQTPIPLNHVVDATTASYVPINTNFVL